MPPAARRSSLRRRLPVVAAAVMAVFAGAVVVWSLRPTDPENPRVGRSPPLPTLPGGLDGGRLLDVDLTTPSGATVRLRDRTGGELLLVNFWAQWCAPCIAEMPILERASRRFTDVRFVGINERDSVDQARGMVRRTRITYPWLLDRQGEAAAAAETVNLPTTLLIRPDGTIAASKVGAFHSLDQLRRWIDDARPEPRPPATGP